MTWWCAATRLPWDWTPRAYPGVWAFMVALAAGGWLAARRSGVRLTGRQRAAWVAGLLSLWVATDWPVGALGSGYLASAHMVQYMLYTFVAAPLLLVAVPEEMARRLLGTGRARRLAAQLARPVVGAIVANLIMVGTHAPWTVDTLRASQAGSFALDVIWLIGGLALWAPVVSPLPEHRPAPFVRAAYLFLAAGLVPMLPGGFLTFADGPLYALYEMAPRVGDIDPTADQQAAGVLMKVGNVPLIWPVIGAILVRHARADAHPAPSVDPVPARSGRAHDHPPRQNGLHPPAPPFSRGEGAPTITHRARTEGRPGG